jgi:hypothetical protein
MAAIDIGGMVVQPFISSTDLSDYLERTLDSEKAVIAVDSACQSLRNTINQSLDFKQNDVVALDSEGTETILLPELPVIGVTSVVGPGELTLVEGTDFVVDKKLGAIRTKQRGYRFLRGRQLYTVTYSHGFTDDLTGKPAGTQLWPSSLRILALTLATRIYDQTIVRQESVGGSQTIYSAPESLGLSDRERNLLESVVGIGRRR